MPQVFSSLTATRKLLEDRCLRPFLLLHPDVLPDFEGLPTGGNPNCVVVGLAQEAFSWGNMNQAFRILQKGGERSVNAAVRAAGGA
jgi:phospholysine phosphohistidine inorganic pyrophosphate phosphatase